MLEGLSSSDVRCIPALHADPEELRIVLPACTPSWDIPGMGLASVWYMVKRPSLMMLILELKELELQVTQCII